MMRTFNFLGIIGLCIMMFSSCLDDLNLTPIDPDENTEEAVYTGIDGYYSVLAKVYAGLALTGQVGPAGNGDVGGIDEGFSSYIRGLWNLQVLPTDEAICAWVADFGIPELNNIEFSSANPFVEGFYYRIYQQVSMANEFLRQSTDDKLSSRGQSSLSTEVAQLRAEARFLRAFSYWHGIDLFGNIAFVTDATPIGLTLPEQLSRTEVFNWLIGELNEIEPALAEAGEAEYGRVDKGALWMLKAKLYLNAEIYMGTVMYDEMIVELEKVISNYTFFTGNYSEMFLGDNNKLENPTATSGFIFSIPQDGEKMQSFGGSNFIIFGAIGGDMTPSLLDASAAWGGNRLLPVFVDRFDSGDRRGAIENHVIRRYFIDDDLVTPDEERDTVLSGYGGNIFNSETLTTERYRIDTIIDITAEQGYTLDLVYIDSVVTNPGTKAIDDIATFSNGYASLKFRNTRSDGIEPSIKDFVYTDFPIFRLADAYLMYAEGALRGATGADMATAVTYINTIRQRAFGDNSGDITSADIDEDFILNERSRELYWECSRRTDLIRFDRFTSASFVWSWKGGIIGGREVNSKFNLYAIPSKDVNANPNIEQNEGY